MGAKPIGTASAFVMGLVVLWAGTALAGETEGLSAGDAVETQRKTEDDSSRRVCRNITPTGSRMTERKCRTQAEWDASRKKTQDGHLNELLGYGTTYEQAPGPR